MTQDEMQRFLDQASRDGYSEFDAYKRLIEVIGISYHPTENKKPEKPKD